ncbi:hypothetical protein [Vibrio alginolyticus]|uniref:hypothetical protein n=1 Tax=Vibrio alginolyticus TaxID=663 RepID=UPI003D7E9B3A
MKRVNLVISIFSILLSFGGNATPLPCTAYNGVPVQYIANPQLNNVGMANVMMNGQPMIQLNPNVINQLPYQVRQFWYAHECAHHALFPQQNSEVNADCWAIKTIRNLGIIQNQQQITQLLNYISTLPGSMQAICQGQQGHRISIGVSTHNKAFKRDSQRLAVSV